MWSLPLYSSYYLIVEERETLLLKLILKSIPWSKTRLEYLWRAVGSKSTAIATAKTAVDNSTTLHIYFECERNDLCLLLLLYPAIAKCILFFFFQWVYAKVVFCLQSTWHCKYSCKIDFWNGKALQEQVSHWLWCCLCWILLKYINKNVLPAYYLDLSEQFYLLFFCLVRASGKRNKNKEEYKSRYFQLIPSYWRVPFTLSFGNFCSVEVS